MNPLIVPGNLDSLSGIRHFVLEAAAQAGLDKKAAYRLQLAVDEIATNIIVYGYEQAGKTGLVTVQAEINPEALTVTLEDSSGPFDPRPFERLGDLDKPIEERPIGGLGVYLAIENVDRFNYEYVNNRNRNIFIVRRPSAEATPPG